MGAAGRMAQISARRMVAAFIREHAVENEDFLTSAVQVPLEP